MCPDRPVRITRTITLLECDARILREALVAARKAVKRFIKRSRRDRGKGKR